MADGIRDPNEGKSKPRRRGVFNRTLGQRTTDKPDREEPSKEEQLGDSDTQPTEEPTSDGKSKSRWFAIIAISLLVLLVLAYVLREVPFNDTRVAEQVATKLAAIASETATAVAAREATSAVATKTAIAKTRAAEQIERTIETRIAATRTAEAKATATVTAAASATAAVKASRVANETAMAAASATAAVNASATAWASTECDERENRPPCRYTVLQNDSYLKIAEKFYSEASLWPALCDFQILNGVENTDDTCRLNEGQELQIPLRNDLP